MAVRAEAAGSLTWYAALNSAGGSPPGDVARLAGYAKALAGEYALQSGADNIQNHGGMGFTAESGVHRYLRRALVWNTVLGLPAVLLAEALGDGESVVASPIGAS